MIVASRSARETRLIASEVASQLRAGDLVVLAGDLGAGKTTFAQGLVAGLGSSDAVTSPTFTIVQQYDARVPVAHVDVYRLVRVQELHDLGLEELLDDHIVLVEWGEAATRALPPDRLVIRLATQSELDDARTIELVGEGRRWVTRMSAVERALSARRTA